MKSNINKALLILLLYSLFLLVFSTEIIIKEYMNVRREMRIESPNLEHVKTLLISKRFWNDLKNKKEFRVNETYYDLISFKEKKNTIVARVVVDDFEIVLRKTAQNLMKKNSKNKKNYSSISISVLPNDTFEMNLLDPFCNREIIDRITLNHDDNFANNIFQPPCYNPIA
jgi:hypothetical protein